MSSQCRSFVIADLHLGHENICKFTRDSGEKLRPWDNVDEMNAALITNWNTTVRDTDKVYVLGDFTVNKKFVHLGSQLNGRKILVAGNHDNATPQMYMDAGFEDVVGCYVMYKKNIIMSHIPLHPHQLNRFSGGNMHGHLHDLRVRRDFSDAIDGRYLCVSVEQPHVSYKPLLLDKAIIILEEQQA